MIQGAEQDGIRYTECDACSNRLRHVKRRTRTPRWMYNKAHACAREAPVHEQEQVSRAHAEPLSRLERDWRVGLVAGEKMSAQFPRRKIKMEKERTDVQVEQEQEPEYPKKHKVHVALPRSDAKKAAKKINARSRDEDPTPNRTRSLMMADATQQHTWGGEAWVFYIPSSNQSI
ncbi:hypothetical protein K438DRAFT_1762269 [Mycena galopus ATCC 62051]|nr:hypothetical protein K438DRAFT_1762269 [Mycena galopus ATCC 62051]